jgi:hypothetical protein
VVLASASDISREISVPSKITGSMPASRNLCAFSTDRVVPATLSASPATSLA